MVGVEVEVGHPAEHLFEGDLDLEPRECCADAVVRPSAEGDMAGCVLAVHIELSRVLEGALVAVGRREEQHEPRPLG